jgi:hypothetical protein
VSYYFVFLRKVMEKPSNPFDGFRLLWDLRVF